MYHIDLFVRRAGLVAAVAAGLALGAGTAAAQANATSCRATMASALGKFETSVQKAVSKCETGKVAGKVTASCDPFAGTPDANLVAGIAKAQTKFEEAVDEACTGVAVTSLGFAGCADPYGDGCDAEFTVTALRGVCAGGANVNKTCDADSDCPASTCTPTGPNLVTPASLTEIKNCLACNVQSNAGHLNALADSFAPAGADKALSKCQQAILKQATKLASGLSKGLGKCEPKTPNFGGSCPGGKDITKAIKTAAKVDASIAKSCAGLTPAAIGNPGACPATDGQGFATGNCADISLASLDDIADCVTCIATKSTTRLTAGNCGNSYVDFEVGETCDDGNQEDGDACPADCRVSQCTLDPAGTTTDIQVAFEAPDGVDVAALEIFVSYPEHAVIVPGTGDVSANVTNTPAGASVTVVDTNAGLSVVVTDGSLNPIPAGGLFDLTLENCVSQTAGEVALSKAPWEALAPVTAPKFSNFVCVVDSAVDTNLNPVEGVTCEVVKP